MAMKVGTRPIGSTTTTKVTSADMRNSTGIAGGSGGRIGGRRSTFERARGSVNRSACGSFAALRQTLLKRYSKPLKKRD
jgi:hypothetical protein